MQRNIERVVCMCVRVLCAASFFFFLRICNAVPKTLEIPNQCPTGCRRCLPATNQGSCLKTGQHSIFAIIYLLLPINLDSVSKILFNFCYCK